MPRQFFAMVRVELLKVFTQWSGIGALAIAVIVGLFAVGGMHWVNGLQDSAQINGQPVSGLVQNDAVGAGAWALNARNFFVLPMLLFLATASSVAGEQSERTLRELVVRPVPRWSILAAKTVALWVLSLLTLFATFTTSVALGWIALGPPAVDQSVAEGSESVLRLCLGFGASFVSDVALIALGMALATFVRSVGLVVVSLLLLLMADGFVWLVLQGIGMVTDETWPDTAVKWTLFGAMRCWNTWKTEFEPTQFVAVVVITAITTAVAHIRFARTDVP